MSYRASGSAPGTFLSKPLQLPSCEAAEVLQLWLNVETSVDGVVAVQLRGNADASTTMIQARPYVGNSVYAQMQWEDGRNTSKTSAALPRTFMGVVARLHVKLLNADLWSFNFKCELME